MRRSRSWQTVAGLSVPPATPPWARGVAADAQFLHTLAIIMGGVLGAIVWDLLTWFWGLPTSSSHALIGGLVGSAVLAGGVQAILFPSAGNMLLFLELTFIAFSAGAVAVLVWGFARRDSPTLGTVILAGLVTGLFPAIILARVLLKGLVQIAVSL